MFWALFMCLSPNFGIGCAGRVSQGIGTQPASAVFHLGHLKKRSFRDFFFDAVVTSNEHPRYVKPVLGLPNAFIILFGYWVRRGGGVLKGLVHNMFLHFFTLGSSKIEVS